MARQASKGLFFIAKTHGGEWVKKCQLSKMHSEGCIHTIINININTHQLVRVFDKIITVLVPFIITRIGFDLREGSSGNKLCLIVI